MAKAKLFTVVLTDEELGFLDRTMTNVHEILLEKRNSITASKADITDLWAVNSVLDNVNCIIAAIKAAKEDGEYDNH